MQLQPFLKKVKELEKDYDISVNFEVREDTNNELFIKGKAGVYLSTKRKPEK